MPTTAQFSDAPAFARLLLLCVCALAATNAAAQATSDYPLGDMELVSCGKGSLEYLPGDYYFRAGYSAIQAGNTRKALSMFESSAGWGDKRAMFNLGLILLRGTGTPRNEPLGLAWLALAAERRKDLLQRDTLASAWQAATPDTRDAATALWNTMKLKYADRVALVRAQTYYARRTSWLRNAFRSDLMRIDGLCGPKNVREVIQTLDDIAEETILRPQTTRDGKVIVGAPEKANMPAESSPKP